MILSLSSCEEVNNLSNDGVKGPYVTIYSYAIPAGTDPDATVKLRFVPNPECSDFYVLIEKKIDKEAFLAQNDQKAYAEKVVQSGTKYPAKDLDYVNETLAATYAVTAVGVSADGVKGEPAEFTFNGTEWSLVGTALYTDSTFTAVNKEPAKWYKSTNLPVVRYKLEVAPASWGNYPIVMKLNWNTTTGAITFFNGQASPTAGYWRFPTPFTHATYGAYWQEIDLTAGNTGNPYGKALYRSASNDILMGVRRVVSAGSFAGWYRIQIVLP